MQLDARGGAGGGGAGGSPLLWTHGTPPIPSWSWAVLRIRRPKLKDRELLPFTWQLGHVEASGFSFLTQEMGIRVPSLNTRCHVGICGHHGACRVHLTNICCTQEGWEVTLHWATMAPSAPTCSEVPR